MATGTTWDFDEETEPDEQEQQQQQQAKPKGGGLRAFAEQAKRENEALKEQLAKLQEAERTRNVEAALKAKGFDPEIADLVPGKVAGDPAELDKWLTDRAKLFNTKTKTDTGDDDGRQPSDDDRVDKDQDEDEFGDDADAWGRMARANANAVSPSRQADTLHAIQNAKSRTELDALLKKFGNQNVS